MGLVESFQQLKKQESKQTILSDISLLNELEERGSEIQKGNFFTQEEVVKLLKIQRNFQIK
ncbi:MAG: hypothetical protein AAF960_22595 [Bacteroidota bacterium]